MSRLEFRQKNQAQKDVERLYGDLQRRVIASPPSQCPVDMTGSFLKLCMAQSCGKCTPCRAGINQMINIIENILDVNVKSTLSDLHLLKDTAEAVRDSSDCAIGAESANIVLKGLDSFTEDYVSHVERNRCSEGVRDKRHGIPCNALCPAEVDIPGYIALVKDGRCDDAVRLIRKDNPFPSVCAHICEHPCESHCKRTLIDSPVNIRGLKMFAIDNCSEKVPNPEKMDDTGRTVAVIGGGPSGLTCAYYLTLMGHRVTLFEKRAQLGGMLRYGIPSYRLPRKKLDWDIQSILDAGVNVKMDVDLSGDSDIKNIIQTYDAVYLAIGAQSSKKIGIPGEDSIGVMSAVELLRGIGDENMPDFTDKRVVVVGGGNVAMDVARTAMRLGASHVDIAYRRRRSDMPALEEEVDGAVAEGCRILELRKPVRIDADEEGKVKAFVLKPQKVGVYDKAGRPQVFPTVEKEEVLPCDIIIGAIGQEIDSDSFEKAGIAVKWKKIATDTTNRIAGMTNVFAGGDGITGPSTVINAIAAGKVAAANIDNYLGYNHEVRVDIDIPKQTLEDKVPCGRSDMSTQYASYNDRNFDGFESGLLLEEALQEASRCLRCDCNSMGSFRGGRQDKW